MKFDVTLAGKLIVEPEYPGEEYDCATEVEEAFDETMRELVNLHIEDPSVTGSATSGRFEVALVVDAESPLEAVTSAYAVIRTALHTAKVNTSDWPNGSRFRVQWHRLEAADEPVGV